MLELSYASEKARALAQLPKVLSQDIHKKVEESTIKTVSSGYVKVAVTALFFGLSVLFYVIREGWSVADAFLFVVITISTVGYGTIHPTSADTRIYTIFLMVFGVVAIFSTLTSFVNQGIKRLKVYLSNSMTSRLKQTEWLFRQRLYFSIFWIVLCALVGAIVLQQLEGWDFISCLYFIVETITTVGYGDFTVEQEATKIFLCFYIVVSVTLLGLAIQNLYSLIRNRKVLAQRKELLVLQQKLHFLANMNEGKGVNKFEFVLTILEHIGTLDYEKDVEPWMHKFEELDKAGVGVLDKEQLAHFTEENEKECEEQIEILELSDVNLQKIHHPPHDSGTGGVSTAHESGRMRRGFSLWSSGEGLHALAGSEEGGDVEHGAARSSSPGPPCEHSPVDMEVSESGDWLAELGIPRSRAASAWDGFRRLSMTGTAGIAVGDGAPPNTAALEPRDSQESVRPPKERRSNSVASIEPRSSRDSLISSKDRRSSVSRSPLNLPTGDGTYVDFFAPSNLIPAMVSSLLPFEPINPEGRGRSGSRSDVHVLLEQTACPLHEGADSFV